MAKHVGGRPRRTNITNKSRTIRCTQDDDARLVRLQARYPDKNASELYRLGLWLIEQAPDLTGIQRLVHHANRSQSLWRAAAHAVLDDLQAMGIETASSHMLQKLVEEKTP
jgi:hypothetical protein